MFGEIVVDHQNVLALMHKVFRHGAGSVGGQILHGGAVGGGGCHDHTVLQGAALGKRGYQIGNAGGLLADGAVDADDARILLVDHG